MNLQETLNRLQENVEISLPEHGIEEKLQLAKNQNRKLVIKLGFDPTAPNLHLGHAVILKKLRQFQELEHIIVIIIGDFTARIGDPTGKNKSRPPLSAEQVAINAQTYINQLSKVLDVSKCSVRFNSEWLGQMKMTQTVQLLSQITLAKIMQRTDFSNRFKKNMPISMHELIYPLLQGYDSVQVEADIEMGGTDQLFNCAMGRELQEGLGKAGQVVLCMPLLKGIDGSAKMSKSEDNIVGLTDAPDDMFGKIMSIPDTLLPDYILLATNFSAIEKDALIESLENDMNPMLVKKLIGYNIVSQYHSEEQARMAQSFFEKQFQQKGSDNKQFQAVSLTSLALLETNNITLIYVCKSLKSMMSMSHIRRLVESGSVTVNGYKIVDPNCPIDIKQLPIKVKIGKRDYFQIVE